MRKHVCMMIGLVGFVALCSESIANDETQDGSSVSRASVTSNQQTEESSPRDHTHQHTAGSSAEVVCTEAGCHGLDPSITVAPDHAAQVVAALDEVDKELAETVRKLAPCEHCGLGPALDQQSLLVVSINPESRVKVDRGPVVLELKPNQWNTFLVRVQNLAGSTAPLRAFSDQFVVQGKPAARRRWLELEFVETTELRRELSGAILEYRVIRLRTSDTGKRAAILAMDIGQGTSDIGFRNDIMLTFQCQE